MNRKNENTRDDLSITASARVITGKSGSSATKSKVKADSSWQEEAWDMYDLVGELHFLVNTLARQTSRARLYAGEQVADDERPKKTENQDVQDALASLGEARGGRAQLLRRLALNLYVPGDGFLVGVPPLVDGVRAEVNEDLALIHRDWHFLSVSEIAMKNQDKTVQITMDMGEKVEFPVEDVHLIRIWESHPRMWWESDSAVRSALPILKEIVGLTMHTAAQIDSRLAGAGVLVIPRSAQVSIRESAAQAAGAEYAESDEFTSSLMDAMIEPIGDRASAAAVVPLVVTVPDDAVEKFNHISFASDLDATARENREAAIKRLALTMDAPPEVLLGTDSMNHWGGWLVEEKTVKSHIEPPLELICDALTTSYLWPALVEAGMDEEEAQQYVIWYDVDHLITRPNIGADAKDLYDRGALSDEALRSANGFDDTDAPDKNKSSEAWRRYAMDLIKSNPALITDPGVPAVLAAAQGLFSLDPEEANLPDPVDDPDEPAVDDEAPEDEDQEPIIEDENEDGAGVLPSNGMGEAEPEGVR